MSDTVNPAGEVLSGVEAIGQELLMVVGTMLPLLGPGGLAASGVISTLEKVVPLAIDEANALIPEIQNIIGALKQTVTSPADLAVLAALDAQVDAAFDEATKDIPASGS